MARQHGKGAKEGAGEDREGENETSYGQYLVFSSMLWVEVMHCSVLQH